MTDGHRQRVGDVMGVGAVARPSRRVTMRATCALSARPLAHTAPLTCWGCRTASARPAGRRPQHHAARLADGERGADVGAEVQLLDGHRLGLMLVEQLADALVDVGEPPLQPHPRAGLDDALVDRTRREPTPRTTPYPVWRCRDRCRGRACRHILRAGPDASQRNPPPYLMFCADVIRLARTPLCTGAWRAQVARRLSAAPAGRGCAGRARRRLAAAPAHAGAQNTVVDGPARHPLA